MGKFSLEGHVLTDDLAPDHPDWAHHLHFSNDLVETVMERGAIARATWLTIETQFLGNQETRALYLDAQFRNFVQGDLSITEYCQHST